MCFHVAVISIQHPVLEEFVLITRDENKAAAVSRVEDLLKLRVLDIWKGH